MANAMAIVRRGFVLDRRKVLSYAFLTALTMSFGSGCSSFQTICSTEWMKSPWGDQEPQQAVSHVLSRWENNVRTTNNNQAGGAPIVGLAGRVYLMNETMGQNVNAQGELLVQLFDMTAAGPDSPPQKILEVRYDPIALKQLKRKDLIGEGYTLFLPWENFNPAIKKVQVQVSYQPKNGTPQYGDPTMVSLQTDQPLPSLTQQNIVPAAHYQPTGPSVNNTRR